MMKIVYEGSMEMHTYDKDKMREFIIKNDRDAFCKYYKVIFLENFL